MSPVGRVLFLQRTLPPEVSAAGSLALDLAHGFAAAGWEAGMAAAIGRPDLPPDASGGCVEIRRAGRAGFDRASVASRALALPAAFGGIFQAGLSFPKPDLVISLSDPPLGVVLGAAVAALWRARHLHWCQDLYPETAAAAGILGASSPAFRLLRGISRAAMRSCDAVVVPGRCMARGLLPLRTRVVANWARLPEIPPCPRPPGERFRILYSGNIGRAHEFGGVLGAARLLAGGPVEFVFCGRGPMAAGLVRAAAGLPNVSFHDPVDEGSLAAHLAACDAHLITLGTKFCGLVVPSKLYDSCLAGRPVLFAGPAESETALAIRGNSLGLAVPADDPRALAAAVGTLIADAAFRGACGENAREFAARNRAGRAFAQFLLLAEQICSADGISQKTS